MSNQITPNPSVPSQVVQEVKFPQFVNNLGIIPTSYKDSMNYYETLAWLCKYLEETVIPTVNQNGDAVEELQGLYIELNEYVDHYFDTLDVQEEINNKLDQMATDGSLYEIIRRFTDPIIALQNEQISAMQSQIVNINSKVNSATSGSPAGVYDTLSDLETADPNHSKIYLVLATGKWYYYSTTDSEWAEGGVYQSTGINDYSLPKDKMNYFSETKNLFNKNTALFGYIIQLSNGVALPTSETGVYYATDYIELDSTDPTYKPVITHSSTHGRNAFAWYDSSKTFISSSNSTAMTLSIPANAKYVRFTVKDTIEDFCVSYGGFPYLLDNLSFNSNDKKLIKSMCIEKIENENCLVKKENVMQGYFEAGSVSNGSIIQPISDTSGQFYGITDFIPLDYGETIYANHNFGFKSEYNENFTLIKNVYSGSVSHYTPAEATCKYIRILEYTQFHDDYIYSKSSSGYSEYIPEYFPKLENNSIGIEKLKTNTVELFKPLHGKKVTFLGDSITYGYNGASTDTRVSYPYPAIIQTNAEIISTNSGINGSTIAGNGNGDGSNPMNLRVQNVNTSQDILILFGGTNDFGSNREIGTITDSSNTTFYGALNSIFDYYYSNLIENGMKIGVITPIHRRYGTTQNTEGYTLTDYVNAIKNVCDKYSIPVLDLYNHGCVYPENTNFRNAFLPDGLHPNQTLYYKLADQIEKFLLTL